MAAGFYWGMATLWGADGPCDEPPIIRPVSASESVIVIRVRHAQDVPLDYDGVATVAFAAVVGTAAPDGTVLLHDGELSLPSERLCIGAAERVQELLVPPGGRRVQIEAEPEHAVRVRAWIT